MLKEKLSSYGTVVKIDILTGTKVAIAQMSRPQECVKASVALNGSNFAGNIISVSNNPLDVL